MITAWPRRSGGRRLGRIWFRSGLLLPIFLLVPDFEVPRQATTEYEAKAVILYRLASFVEWPDWVIALEGSPFTIGVLGRDRFAGSLDQLEEMTALGRPVRVVRFPDVESLEAVDILFVSGSERNLEALLVAVEGRAVLTVGEASDFADVGGMIRLYLEGSRIKLEVNRCAAMRAGLQISSRLLRLAELSSAGC